MKNELYILVKIRVKILSLDTIIISIMSIYEELKSTLAMEATTMTKVAELLKVKKDRNLTMNNLSRKLRSKTIKFEEVRDILDVIDYDIVFVKRKK